MRGAPNQAPEQRARREIDVDLTAAGWLVHSRDELDLFAGEKRIVIPTVYRANYLSALRPLSQSGRAEPLMRMFDYAQKWTAAVARRLVEDSRRELNACNTFLGPNVAEEEGKRLRMPGGTVA